MTIAQIFMHWTEIEQGDLLAASRNREAAITGSQSGKIQRDQWIERMRRSLDHDD